MSEPVSVRIDERIARIQLNRPQVLNALDPAMAESLRAAVDAVAADAGTRCVVLSGAGPAFMAGGDLTYFKQALPRLSAGDTAGLDPIFDNIHAVIKGLRHLPGPVVARVHGAVAGFGMSLMMACDLVMAAVSTQFTLAYCGIGASPDGGSTFALPRISGLRRAMELALLGERFDADRARRLGLVNWVVPDPDLEPECESLAHRLAAGPALALAQTKRLINQSLDNGLDRQLEMERDAFFGCTGTPDFAEGITAFLDKRKPVFDG